MYGLIIKGDIISSKLGMVLGFKVLQSQNSAKQLECIVALAALKHSNHHFLGYSELTLNRPLVTRNAHREAPQHTWTILGEVAYQLVVSGQAERMDSQEFASGCFYGRMRVQPGRMFTVIIVVEIRCCNVWSDGEVICCLRDGWWQWRLAIRIGILRARNICRWKL